MSYEVGSGGPVTDEEWEADNARYLAKAVSLRRKFGLSAAVPEAKSKLAVDSSTLQFRVREQDGESVVEMGSGMGWVVIAKFPGVFGGVRAASYAQFMVENGRR